jgi:hypothetical protein
MMTLGFRILAVTPAELINIMLVEAMLAIS